MTLQDCQKLVCDAGFTNFHSADWENDHHIYAFSVESHGAATFGHPKHTVHFNKLSNFLEQTGKPAVKVEPLYYSMQGAADRYADEQQAIADENERREKRNAKARSRRRAKASAMDSIGMKRVRGNLGGSFWE